MNTDRQSVERVANTLALHWNYVDEPHPAALLRALLAERDEARALAKRWRDLYEWDYDGPLPTYHFPWEKP